MVIAKTALSKVLSPRGRGMRIAVLLPCYNEATAIGFVIDDFRKSLPNAEIYVYDNNSTDGTAAVAAAHGAIVRREMRQGKGNVVRRMFGDVDADIYLLADGDNTYDASSAPLLINALLEGPFDVVNGARVEQSTRAYRPGHRFGNRLFSAVVQRAFGATWSDMLSGYKVMTRRFVKTFPIVSHGFEIETELLIHTSETQASTIEIHTSYCERGDNSFSKLHTLRDGIRILRVIFIMIKDKRPLQFFSTIAGLLALASVVLAWPLFIEFARTGLVPRLPTAVLATGLMLVAFLSVFSGLLLDGIATSRREAKRLAYLALPGLPENIDAK
jgi:glycosyltransferase involved in cell wall biosynthesis